MDRIQYTYAAVFVLLFVPLAAVSLALFPNWIALLITIGGAFSGTAFIAPWIVARLEARRTSKES